MGKNMKANLKINYEKGTGKGANPLIFGHFIEFMRDCIDGGMWAQLLDNRGFDRKKEMPEGVVDGNPNVAAGWYRTGGKNAFDIALDGDNSLAKDGFSQKIMCYNDYDGYVGIAQNRIYLEKGTYQGYFWAKAEGKEELESIAMPKRNAGSECNVEVELCLYDEDGGFCHSHRFQVNSQWEKFAFLFPVDTKTRCGVYEIRLLGEGTVWLDGTSLMPEDTQNGIWKEVYRHIKALNPPVIRFPGGCFADCYCWMDGIGERDLRPYRFNRHWGGFEDNSFGTDEYMELCESIGCEPMICVNFGSGTPEEAAAWVEYCNGGEDTFYGSMRAKNGHPKPYNIKYWDIGNETFGDWEIGHCSAEEYAHKYLKFYEAMKEKDENIVFMVCGGDGDDRSQKWNQMVAEWAGTKMDALCLHMYVLKAMEKKHYDNKDIYYAVTGAVKKYEEILANSYKTVRKVNAKAKVAVTEYNMGTLIDSYREQTLEAAIFNAGMLNMFLRNTEKLTMCNISDLVNGWPGGCIVSKNGHAYGTASYYVMKMYSEAEIEEVLEGEMECRTYDTKEQIGNIEPLKDIPYVDAVACRNREGKIVIFAVNRSLTEEVCLRIGLEGKEAQVTELNGEKVSDSNSEGEMLIVPKGRKIVVENGEIRLRAHSVNRILILLSR